MVQLYFFEAGVVILIPLAFGLAKKKKINIILCDSSSGRFGNRICLYSTICGICTCCEYAECRFGVMIAVGVPVGILSLIFAGILWSKLIGNRMNTGLPSNIQEVREAEDGNLPPFYSAVYYSCSAGFNLM